MPERAPDTAGEFVFPSVRGLLDRLGVRLSKSRSQHFLVNRAWCERIAELCGLTPQHTAVEIGAGLGNLSTELARRAGRVHSVEMDESFRDWHVQLAEHFPNLGLVYRDFMKIDLEALCPPGDGPYVAAGNLPYQITAPILFRLISAPVAWERIVIMVQLEVAQRLVAGPGTREASALTFKVALEYDTVMPYKLGPQEFLPPPRVHSAVVVLTPKPEPLVSSPEQKARVHALLTGAFQHRRRTVENALALARLTPGRDAAAEALTAAGIDPKLRPEKLTLEDFIRLDEALHTRGHTP